MRNKKELITAISLAVIFLFLTIFIPSLIGFAGKGFDTQEIILQFTIYSAIATAGLMGILGLFFIEKLITKGDNKYGDSVLFASPGEFPALSFFKRFSNFKLFLLSIITFSIFGMFIFNVREQSFTGITFLEQQFTEIGSISFSTFLIPAAENLPFAFVLAFILVLGIRGLARKHNWSSANVQSLSLVILPLAGALIGTANHLLRYQGSDIALISVAAFWGMGGLLTALTGSFIPFWVMHLTNNLFMDLKRFTSNELVFVYIGVTIIIFIGLYFLIYRSKKEQNE